MNRTSFGRLVKTLTAISGVLPYFQVAACVYVGEVEGPDYVTIEHGAFVKDSTIAREASSFCSRHGRQPVLVQGDNERTKFRCVGALRLSKTSTE